MNTSLVSQIYNLVVIGAGPAGLLAAWRAASQGAEVLLLEKGDKVARKLAVSGGSRGNFTHAARRTELLEAYYGKKQQRFLRPAFTAFDTDDARAFFALHGIASSVEASGKVFPVSNRAQDLVDALVKSCASEAVSIQCNAAVDALHYDKEKQRFSIHITPNEKCALETVLAEKVILATGGKTYPHTGSDGSGYALAQSCGHSLTALFPALQAINLDEPELAGLSGLSLPDVTVKLTVQDKKYYSRGELLFTHFGLSGPAALHISRFLEIDPVTENLLSLDFLPEISFEELTNLIMRFSVEDAKKSAKSFFFALLPQRLAQVLAEMIWDKNIFNKTAAHITKEDRLRMLQLLKQLPIRLGQARPFEQAMLTRGGVALDEVNPKTMESRLCTGLYFSGEILDIDGPSGGYNVQAAFSTGYLAGTSAAVRDV